MKERIDVTAAGMSPNEFSEFLERVLTGGLYEFGDEIRGNGVRPDYIILDDIKEAGLDSDKKVGGSASLLVQEMLGKKKEKKKKDKQQIKDPKANPFNVNIAMPQSTMNTYIDFSQVLMVLSQGGAVKVPFLKDKNILFAEILLRPMTEPETTYKLVSYEAFRTGDFSQAVEVEFSNDYIKCKEYEVI